MKTIVALVDLSGATSAVVEQAKILARAFQSHVILIHGVPLQPDMIDLAVVSPAYLREPNPKEWTDHQTKLFAVRDSLAAAGIQVTAEQFQALTVDKVLAEIRRFNADLVIVGEHHHGMLYDLFIGSMSHDVLKKAPCPVLAVPATAVSVRQKEAETAKA